MDKEDAGGCCGCAVAVVVGIIAIPVVAFVAKLVWIAVKWSWNLVG